MVVLLDAGDEFTGTLWDTIYKGIDSAIWQNYIGVEAMAIGNHEFDFGEDGLLNYTAVSNFPILSANTNFSAFPSLAANILPYTIIKLDNGQQVGVIGITTTETPETGSPSDLITFDDEVTVLQAYIDMLRADGIEYIVGLLHTGYEVDVSIASQVEGLDIIVGGHSHTFLYNTDEAELPVLYYKEPTGAKVDKPKGPYPTVVNGTDGNPVLVVQALWGTRYLGKITLEYCSGQLTDWSGNPVLVNNSEITPDPKIQALIDQYSGPIVAAFNEVMGETTEDLFREPYKGENNLGNAVTDSMWWAAEQVPWIKDAQQPIIAFQNSGGLRSDVPAGTITYGTIKTLLPFGNWGYLQNVSGSDILAVLEVNHGDKDTGFLQVSGLRYGFDPTKPNGERVQKAYATHTPNNVDELIDPNNYYLVVNNNFVGDGGDGFPMFGKYPTLYPQIIEDATIFQEYLKANTPISPTIEGRIVDCSELSAGDGPNSSAASELCNTAVEAAGK